VHTRRHMTGSRAPAPWAHLLIDHEVTRSLLRAMEEEARRLYDGQPLRPGFWERAVELMDGFIERCHRRVEEEVIFPKLLEYGDAGRDEVAQLAKDHGRAHALTDTLCEGIRNGDWESVLRMAMIYVSGLRKHMEAEEQAFTALGDMQLPADVMREMRAQADAIEAEAMGENGPGYFVDLVHQLCAATDIPEHLRPGGVPGSLGSHSDRQDRQVL